MQKPGLDPNYLNDSLRDAFRYRLLVAELSEVMEHFQPEGGKEPANIEEALARMLSQLCEALNGEQAFIAEVTETGDDQEPRIEVSAAYPSKKLEHRRLPWTPVFEKLLKKQRSMVVGGYLESQQGKVSGLELFGATSAVLVRLKPADKQRIIGICNRRKAYLGPFLAADRMILETLTDLFTFGIDIGERRRQELETIQRTALRISTELTLEELLPEIAANTGRIFHAPVSLMLWDENRTHMVIRASVGLSEPYLRQAIPQRRVEAGLAEMGKQLSRVTADLRSDPYGNPDLILREGLRGVLSAVLKVGENLVGILNIYSKDPARRFDRHDIELAEIFASQAAIAIRNASLRKRVAEDGKKAANLVRSSTDLKELVSFLIDEVVDFLQVQAAGLAFWKEDDRVVRLAGSRGLDGSFTARWCIDREELLALTCREGVCQPRVIADLAAEPFGPQELTRAEDLCSALVAPLASDGRVFGMLVAYSKGAPRRFEPIDLEVTQIFINQAVTAIEAAQAFQKVKDGRDELTQMLETISTIAHAASLEDGLTALAHHLVDWLKITFCHIFTYDPLERMLTKMAAFPVKRKQALDWDADSHKTVRLDEFPGMEYLVNLTAPQVFHKGDRINGQNILEHVKTVLELHKDLNEILVIALTMDNQVLGICTLGEMRDREEYRFDQEKIYRATSLAGQAAALILRLQMQEVTEKRAAREIQLRKAGERITQNAALPLGALTNQIAEMACDILGAPCAVVYPYYEEFGVYDVHSIGAYGLTHPKETTIRAKPRGETGGTANFILTQQNRLVVDDVRRGWSRENTLEILPRVNKFLTRENVQAFVGLRLQIDQEPVGALFVNFREPHYFTSAELDAIQIFASQAAVAIHQARLLMRGEKEQRANDTMSRITQMIGVKTSPRQILEDLLRGVLDIANRNRHGMYIRMEPDGISFRVRVQIGYGSQEVGQVRRSLLFQAIVREKTARLVLDIQEDPVALVSGYQNSAVRSLLAAPFSSTGKGEPDSLIVLESPVPAIFTPDDRSALADLAAFAGIAMQSTGRYEQIRENNRLQSGLLEASQRIMALEMPDAILENIVQSTRIALHCDVVTLHTYNRDLKEIDPGPKIAGELFQPEELASPETVNQTIAGRLVSIGKPHFAPDAENDPKLQGSQFVRSQRIKSSAGIPLIVGREKLGILFVNYRAPHDFSEQEKKIIRLFAGQAALALHNARMFSKLETKNRHMQKVHDASKLIIDSVGWGREKIMSAILREAVETVTGASGEKATIGTIQLHKDGALVFESVYSQDLTPAMRAEIGVGRPLYPSTAGGRLGVTGRAFRTGRAQLVKDVRVDDDYHAFCADTLSELAVPLIDGGRTIGVLNVESNQVNGFDEDDEEALRALADLAVIALHNAERTEELSRANTVAIMGAWGADIAHDINREVGNIRRSVKLLRMRQDMSEEALKRIAKIDGYAEAMSLLDLPAQPGAAQVVEADRSRREVDIFLQQMVRELAEKHPAATLRFEGGAPGVKALMEEQWIRRILRHLVTNAVRECLRSPGDHEPPRIIVRTCLREQSIEVQVEDNGPGVPDELVNRLFKEILPSRGQGGRGLLFVQFLVEHYNGKIWLDWSKPQVGTRFAFSLELYSPKESQAGGKTSEGPADANE